MSKRNTRLTILALTVLLLFSATYIVNDYLDERRDAQLQDAAQQGYTLGVSDALTTAYQQTDNCQVTTITLGNVTRQIVDFACAQQALQQVQQAQQ